MKKSTPKYLAKAAMSLYEESNTKVRAGLTLLDDFNIRVKVHQRSVLSPLLFSIVVDVVTEKCKRTFYILMIWC